MAFADAVAGEVIFAWGVTATTGAPAAGRGAVLGATSREVAVTRGRPLPEFVSAPEAFWGRWPRLHVEAAAGGLPRSWLERPVLCDDALGAVDPSFAEPAEPVVSAAAIEGIHSTAAPMPNAAARAPIRPTT